MASLMIRNIDADVKHRLEARAARHGLSVEEDIRQVITNLVADTPLLERSETPDTSLADVGDGRAGAFSSPMPSSTPDEAVIRQRVKRVLAHARKPDVSTDWKSATDNLYDFLP